MERINIDKKDLKNLSKHLGIAPIEIEEKDLKNLLYILNDNTKDSFFRIGYAISAIEHLIEKSKEEKQQ